MLVARRIAAEGQLPWLLLARDALPRAAAHACTSRVGQAPHELISVISQLTIGTGFLLRHSIEDAWRRILDIYFTL